MRRPYKLAGFSKCVCLMCVWPAQPVSAENVLKIAKLYSSCVWKPDPILLKSCVVMAGQYSVYYSTCKWRDICSDTVMIPYVWKCLRDWSVLLQPILLIPLMTVLHCVSQCIIRVYSEMTLFLEVPIFCSWSWPYSSNVGISMADNLFQCISNDSIVKPMTAIVSMSMSMTVCNDWSMSMPMRLSMCLNACQ
jgi:hypothetical protein